jgi:hypothetical protein
MALHLPFPCSIVDHPDHTVPQDAELVFCATRATQLKFVSGFYLSPTRRFGFLPAFSAFHVAISRFELAWVVLLSTIAQRPN